MSTNNKPITGWVAWHPKWGVTRAALSREVCIAMLSGVNLRELKGTTPTEVLISEEIELTKEGWCFRPVEMRFTDGGGDGE